MSDESKRIAYNQWFFGDEPKGQPGGETVEPQKADKQEEETATVKPGPERQEPSEPEKIEPLREMLSGMVQDNSITKAQQEQLAERARELELAEKVAKMLRRERVRVLPEEQEQRDEQEQQVQKREREEPKDQRQREEYGKRLRLIGMAAAAGFLVIISSVAAYFLFLRSVPEVKINPPPVAIQPQNDMRATKTKPPERDESENVIESSPGRGEPVTPVRVDVTSVLAKAELELNARQLDSASAQLRQAKNLSPTNARLRTLSSQLSEAYYSQARENHKVGNPGKAISDYEKAICWKKQKKYYLYWGWALFEIDQIRKAKETISKGLALKPADSELDRQLREIQQMLP